MKKRLGFVSNSSSSSYTCDSCGNTESGMDLCLSDVSMMECVNGHIFCEDHSSFKFDDDRTIKEKKKIMLDDPDMEVPSDVTDDKIEDMYDEWTSEARYSVPASICPFCSLEGVTDPELIRYWLISTGVTREQVTEQIRQKFPSYEVFKAFIKDPS